MDKQTKKNHKKFLVRLLRFCFELVIKEILFIFYFAEAIVAEFHKKIKDAFEVFDHETNNTVDVRFGNIYCSYNSKLWPQFIEK